MYADVINYVKSQAKYITVKPQRMPSAPFQKISILRRSGQFSSLAFVGPLHNGQYILTMIDHFSKHLKLYTMKKIAIMNTV